MPTQSQMLVRQDLREQGPLRSQRTSMPASFPPSVQSVPPCHHHTAPATGEMRTRRGARPGGRRTAGGSGAGGALRPRGHSAPPRAEGEATICWWRPRPKPGGGGGGTFLPWPFGFGGAPSQAGRCLHFQGKRVLRGPRGPRGPPRASPPRRRPVPSAASRSPAPRRGLINAARRSLLGPHGL